MHLQLLLLPTASPWTYEDANLMMQMREKGSTFENIARRFPGRTASGCTESWRRFRRLGLPERDKKPLLRWTPEEDILLRDLFSKNIPHEKLAEHLPNRTNVACVQRLQTWHRNKILPQHSGKRTAKRWTIEEDSILRHLLGQKLSTSAIAEQLPGRKLEACYHRIRKLGLRKNARIL